MFTKFNEEKYNSIVEAIFTYAEKTPNALFAADVKYSYNYSQAKNAILNAAASFTALGVKTGDHVVVECTQNTAYCIVQQAISLIGAVFVPYDRKMNNDRLMEIIHETDAICTVGTKPVTDKLLYFPISSINPDLMPVDFNYSFPLADQCSEILYSTGTTGKAKGIVLTHSNNIALAENIAYGVHMEIDNVEIIPVSLSHSHGLRTMYANFLNGNAVVIASGVMFLKPFFSLMDQWGVNAMDLVPSAGRILCEHGGKILNTYQDQIRYVELGSEPLTENDKEILHGLLPKSRLYNFYGSTESGRTCTYDFASNPNKSNCIGKPVINAEVLIVDEKQQTIENPSEDNTGYLAFRGPMNMQGYWKNPELTKSIMKNDIFYTKDVGYVDEEGWIFMLGRDDDIINHGGIKINPIDIEEIVMKYDGVKDCGCIGIPDAVSGEAVWLFVQLDPTAQTSSDIVGAWLQKNIDREKRPQRILEIDQIPRTFNGKLHRKKLKEIALDEFINRDK